MGLNKKTLEGYLEHVHLRIKNAAELAKLVQIVDVLREAIEHSIDRSDAHGDPWCSKPIREALTKADEIAGKGPIWD